MAFSGINARATSAYVTDAAADTYTIDDPSIDSYPTTRNSMTFGWVSGGPTGNFRNRSTTPGGISEPRLSGMVFINSTTKGTFRFDLPSGAGVYNIRLAFGDDAAGWSHTCEVQDGTTTFTTITGSTSSAQWMDAGGTARTASAWQSSNTTIQRTFTNSFMTLVIGDGVAAVNSTLAHVALEYVGSGGSTSLPPQSIVLSQAAGRASFY